MDSNFQFRSDALFCCTSLGYFAKEDNELTYLKYYLSFVVMNQIIYKFVFWSCFLSLPFSHKTDVNLELILKDSDEQGWPVTVALEIYWGLRGSWQDGTDTRSLQGRPLFIDQD